MKTRLTTTTDALTEVLYIIEHDGFFSDVKLIEEALRYAGLAQVQIDYYKKKEDIQEG